MLTGSKLNLPGDTKPLWQSTTFWGVATSSILKIVAMLLPDSGVENLQEPVAQLIVLGASFIGDVVAIYGRVTATKQISGGTK